MPFKRLPFFYKKTAPEGCIHLRRRRFSGCDYTDRFQILFVPVWLLLSILKLAFRLATGAAAFVLIIGGGLLLVYDLFLLIIGLSSKEFVFQLLTIGGMLIVIPFCCGIYHRPAGSSTGTHQRIH